MKTQLQRLEKLLLKGCTSMDIIRVCRTTTPTRRLSDCRENGWTITKVKVPGKNYHRFYGKAPKSQTKEQKRQQTSENRELQELQELQELLKEQLSKARFAVPDGKGYFFSSWREEALHQASCSSAPQDVAAATAAILQAAFIMATADLSAERRAGMFMENK